MHSRQDMCTRQHGTSWLSDEVLHCVCVEASNQGMPVPLGSTRTRQPQACVHCCADHRRLG